MKSGKERALYGSMNSTMSRAKVMVPDGQDLGEINADVGMLKS